MEASSEVIGQIQRDQNRKASRQPTKAPRTMR